MSIVCATESSSTLNAPPGIGPVQYVSATDRGALTRLAAHATEPLLVVRGRDPFQAWREGRAMRVMLGWDDTTTSASALDAVAALRRGGPIDLEIVHVYFPDEAARRYGVRVRTLVDPDPVLETLLRRDLGHQLGHFGGRITLDRGLGRVSDHLLEHAERTGAELIVVGNHHRGGLRRLTSVAAHVLDEATVTVMLVPLQPASALDPVPAVQVVIAATDGTPSGNRAVAYAYRLAPAHGEVHLVRVVDSREKCDDGQLVDELLRMHPSDRTATRTVAHVVRDHDPVHAIATTAERVGADMVCIAAHGRTGLPRLISKSLTDRLLHVCRRPVLVLHPVD